MSPTSDRSIPVQGGHLPWGEAVREWRLHLPHNDLSVCSGPRCILKGCHVIKEEMERAIEMTGLFDRVAVHSIGCLGICEQGPSVVIEPEGVLYTGLRPEDVPVIVGEHLLDGEIAESLCLRDAFTGAPIAHIGDIPGFKSRIHPFNPEEDVETAEAGMAGGGCFVI